MTDTPASSLAPLTHKLCPLPVCRGATALTQAVSHAETQLALCAACRSVLSPPQIVLAQGCLIHARMIHLMSLLLDHEHAGTLLVWSLTWASCGVSAACSYSLLCREVEWARESWSRPKGLSAGRGQEGAVKWCGPAVKGIPVVHLELQPHAGRWCILTSWRDPTLVPACSWLCENVKICMSNCRNIPSAAC